MLDKSSFLTAYERAFPNAGGLPPDVGALEQQIIKARQGVFTADLVVFDRLVAGMGNARLQQFLGTNPAAGSEQSRQHAAKLAGHGDPRAAFRFVDVPQTGALAQIITYPALREVVSAQLLRAARQTSGSTTLLHQNAAVFTGLASSARAAAAEYAEGLENLSMVKTSKVVTVCVDEGQNVHRFCTATRQADLVQRLRKTFESFNSGDAGVLFLDISHAATWREESHPDPRTGPMLLATLGNELVQQLNGKGEGHVVLACDSETLAALCKAEPQLVPRLPDIIRV